MVVKKACKVKVCKVGDVDKRILENLYTNKEGLRAKTLLKLTDLKQSHLYKRLNILSEQGLVENIFPIWKIVNGQSVYVQTLLGSNKLFELHNLGYVLRLMKVPDWWNKRKVKLMRLKGWQFTNNNFGKNNSNPFQQIVNESFVVQTYPESMIIISRKRYYAEDPYETIQQGMSDVLDLIEFLEERFRFKFFPDGVPSLELRANDFNRMKDYLAERCKKEGTRFLVKTPKGKVWVDYSEPVGRESNTPDIQQTLEKDIRDKIMNKPKVNSELEKDISNLRTENLERIRDISSDAINTTMVMKQMQSEVKGLTELVYQLFEVIKKDKD